MTAHTVSVRRKSTGWRRWWLVCTCGWRWPLDGKPVTAAAIATADRIAYEHAWPLGDDLPHASYERGVLAETAAQ